MILVSDKLSTESFHAFIDEQLTDEQYVQVEAQLDEIPEKIEEIQQCQIINERLREVFDPVVEEHIPDDLYDLALYGPTDEPHEPDSSQYVDSTQFGYDYDENAPSSSSGYEDYIESPLDSLDDALHLQDEEFIDEDNEFADLEALSDESLSDFDIDAMGSEDSDIIPDIFDEDVQSASRTAATDNVTADDMLDSLDSLSLEPLADGGATAASSPPASAMGAQQAPMPKPSKRKGGLDNFAATGLELEPLDDEASPSKEQQFETASGTVQDEAVAEADGHLQPGHIDVSEHVLETLKSDEELTLESLGEEPDIRADNTSQATEAENAYALQQEPTAPNQQQDSAAPEQSDLDSPMQSGAHQAATDLEQLPASHSEQTPPTLGPAEVADKANTIAEEQSSQTPAMEPLPQRPRKVLGNRSSAEAEPEPKQVSAMTGNTKPSEDIGHSHSSSHSSASQQPETEQILQQPDATQFSYQARQEDDPPVDHVAPHLNDLAETQDEMATDVVAEFFAEKKANPDFEVHEVVREFEEVSEEFEESSRHSLAQDVFDNPVEQIKQKAGDVLQTLNSRFAELKSKFVKQSSDTSPNFNKPPPLDAYQVPPPPTTEHQRVQASPPGDEAVDIDLSIFNASPDSEVNKQDPGPMTGNAEPDEPKSAFGSQEPSFEFDDNVAEPADNTGSFSNKIGETLKHYKEKLSQGQLTTFSGTTEDLSPVDRIKHWFRSLSVENRGTVGGIVLLIIGLVVGSSTASLYKQTVPAINNEKVEQLAIDAHILYTQQDQNFAGETTTSITESMQWLSARIGKVIRLADIKIEGFKHLHAIVMPTMVNYATANIFQNRDKQKMTLLIAGSTGGVHEAPMSCRIPTAVDGLCSWVKDSVHYVVVANLSLSRVRDFSQDLIQQL